MRNHLRRLAVATCLFAAGIAPALPQAGLAGLSPCAGGTLAASNVSSNVQLSACGPVVILYNTSSQEVFYAIGPTSAIAATAQSSSTSAPSANNYSLPGNTYVVLNVNTQSAYLAAITASSTATLRIVQGYANT
jgi:hypothetical protein